MILECFGCQFQQLASRTRKRFIPFFLFFKLGQEPLRHPVLLGDRKLLGLTEGFFKKFCHKS